MRDRRIWTPASRGGQASLAGETLNEKFTYECDKEHCREVAVGNKRFHRAWNQTQAFLAKLTTKPSTLGPGTAIGRINAIQTIGWPPAHRTN